MNTLSRTLMAKILFLTVFTAFSISCSTGKRFKNFSEESSVKTLTKGTYSLQAEVEWVKSKKDSIDVLLYFTNTGKDEVFIERAAYALEFEGRKGVPNEVEDELQLFAGMKEKKLLIMEFKPELTQKMGKVKIVVSKIFGVKDGKREALPNIEFNLELTK